MFEYSKGKTPISKLKFKIQRKWRNFWNRKALRKLYRKETKNGEKFRFTLNPQGANSDDAIEDALAFFKYKHESKRIDISEYFN